MTDKQLQEREQQEKIRKENYARRSQAAIFYNKVYMKGKENSHYTIEVIASIFAFIETLMDTDKTNDQMISDIDNYLEKIS